MAAKTYRSLGITISAANPKTGEYHDYLPGEDIPASHLGDVTGQALIAVGFVIESPTIASAASSTGGNL